MHIAILFCTLFYNSKERFCRNLNIFPKVHHEITPVSLFVSPYVRILSQKNQTCKAFSIFNKIIIHFQNLIYAETILSIFRNLKLKKKNWSYTNQHLLSSIFLSRMSFYLTL